MRITDIIVEDSLGEKRVSFFSDNKIIECWFDRNASPSKIDELHLASVNQVIKPLNRVFLTLFDGSSVSVRYKKNFPEVGTIEPITITADKNLIKPYQGVRGFNIKGKFSILTPHNKGIGISKNISDKIKRKRLKNLADNSTFSNYGGIIRRSAINYTDDEILKDFENLLSIWNLIKPSESFQNPALIYKGPSLIQKAKLLVPEAKVTNDYLSKEFSKREGFQQLIEAFTYLKHDIPNGGEIFFERTNAMTSIDVDSKDRNLTSGGLNKFSEDALVLALSLVRIRKIAGLVAIDLPRMNKDGLRNCYLIAEIWAKKMFVPTKIFGNTKGGVFEISCSRENNSLDELPGGVASLCVYEGLRKLAKGKLKSSNLILSKSSKEYFDKYMQDEWDKLKIKNPVAKIEMDTNLPDDVYNITSYI